MGVVNNSWTPAQVQTLRSMLSTGATMRAVAEAIGGDVTRNAVIGKAHRLGIVSSSRPALARIAKADKPKPLPKPRARAAPKLVAAPHSEALRGLPLFCRATRHKAAGPEPLGVGLLDLANYGCRYLVDTRAYCGHRTGGGSWCPHRSKLVYAPAKRRAA